MTRYGQGRGELQETLLFCCCVAGKNAMNTARGLERFLGRAGAFFGDHEGRYSPFQLVRLLVACDVDLPRAIMEAGLGCYNHRARTFRALVDSDLDLETCSVEDLEKIPGIGMKTSRFFVLHTRPGVEVAVVDTHVRKFLRDSGLAGMPRRGSVPPRLYRECERAFVDIWKRDHRDTKTLAEFDLMVWNAYAGHGSGGGRRT